MTRAFPLALLVAVGCAQPPPPQCPPAPPPPAAPTTVVAAEVPAPPEVRVVRSDAPEPTPAMMRSLPSLPRPSPNAEVMQMVGVTKVHLSYSSPGVKGRPIWGTLVPFGKVWRTGANAPTKLTVSTDFTFGGKKVEKGSYSVFTIPGEKTWTVILNRDPKNAGAFEHDPKEDVARVEISPQMADSSRERLAFTFEGSTEERTGLMLAWEKLRLTVPIEVDTKKHAQAGIEATVAAAWRPLFNAGRYAFDQGDNDRALELLGKSIAVEGTWWNHWWTAQAYAKAKKVADARRHAQEAMKLGKGDQTFERFFAERVKKALASWPEG